MLSLQSFSPFPEMRFSLTKFRGLTLAAALLALAATLTLGGCGQAPIPEPTAQTQPVESTSPPPTTPLIADATPASRPSPSPTPESRPTSVPSPSPTSTPSPTTTSTSTPSPTTTPRTPTPVAITATPTPTTATPAPTASPTPAPTPSYRRPLTPTSKSSPSCPRTAFPPSWILLSSTPPKRGNSTWPTNPSSAYQLTASTRPTPFPTSVPEKSSTTNWEAWPLRPPGDPSALRAWSLPATSVAKPSPLAYPASSS